MTRKMKLCRMFLILIRMYKISKIRSLGRRSRQWKIHPTNWDWSSGGYHRKVFMRIKEMSETKLFEHTRMTRVVYDALINMVGNFLKKPRQRIGIEERISLTLQHLAHGEPIQTIAWKHKLGKTTVRNIILETCEVLWRELSPIYVAEPTQAQYVDIAVDFKRMWNMPNCVGAIDGKHIAIKCPSNSGSMFYNYKKFFSVVLMAVCDAQYTFTAISIGSYGSQSDGGIFRVSPFGQALLSGQLPLPADAPLSSESLPFPHYFVGDAAFPLKRNLMRPYSSSDLDRTKRIFNYRLSRARRVIENSFGILSARWRILLRTMECSPENCETVVLGCIVLHNFIMLNDHQRWYCPSNYVDREGDDNAIYEGDWRRELNGQTAFRRITTFSRRGGAEAIELRDRLAQYLSNEGAISFQNRIA